MQSHETLLENDIIAKRQNDGRYRIYRWSARSLVPEPGYDGLYDESEMLRHLTALRPSGDTWVSEGNDVAQLIDPSR